MNIFRFGRKSDRVFETLRMCIRGRLTEPDSTIGTEEETDLYFAFRSIASYLGLGYGGSRDHATPPGDWAMNYAEFVQPPNALETTVEFQVGIIDNSKLVIPQFVKCAEMSLAFFGVLKPTVIELTYSPGQAKDMQERLSDGRDLLPDYNEAESVQFLLELDFYSPAPIAVREFKALMPKWDSLPFRMSIESDKECVTPDDYVRGTRTSSRSHITATVSMPDFSFDCVGWIISCCVSSLAPIEATDIRIRLDASNQS